MNAILTRGQAVDHPVRLEALRESELLDTLPQESLDRYTRLAAALLGTPISMITLIDRERQFFLSRTGFPDAIKDLRQTPLTHSFCKHAVVHGEPFVVTDARNDPRVSDNPAVTELGVVSYLGMPLLTRDGVIFGTLCVIGTEPRDWTCDDIARLGDLAAAVMREIELREMTRTARLSLAAREKEHRQERYHLRSMLDKLRSPAATISSCTDQIASSAANLPAWQTDLLHQCKNSAKALLRTTHDIVDNELAEDESVGTLEIETISASLLLRQSIRTLQPLADDADVRLSLEMADVLVFLKVDPRKIERLFVILLTNGIQCSPPKSAVHISFGITEKNGHPMCRVTVADSCDAPVDRRQPVRANSLGERAGLRYCRRVVEAHSGEITVTGAPDGGSAFHCWLPLAVLPAD